ncbi:MAG: hypothetical protein U0R68_16225 [Candidatus Nanopelagicales bacterium]
MMGGLVPAVGQSLGLVPAVAFLMAAIVPVLVVGTLVVRRRPLDDRTRLTVAAAWLAAVLYAVGVWSWVFTWQLLDLVRRVSTGVGSAPWVWPAFEIVTTVVAATIGLAVRHRLRHGRRAPLGSAFAGAVAVTLIGFASAVATQHLVVLWVGRDGSDGLARVSWAATPYVVVMIVVGLLCGWWWRRAWGDESPLATSVALLFAIGSLNGVAQTGTAYVYFSDFLSGLAPVLMLVLTVVAVTAVHATLTTQNDRRLLTALMAGVGALASLVAGAALGLVPAAMLGFWWPGSLGFPSVTPVTVASAVLLVAGVLALTAADRLRGNGSHDDELPTVPSEPVAV